MSDAQREPLPVSDPIDEEIEGRLATVWIGIWLTVLVSLGVAFYALATWDDDNRGPIVVVAALGLASAAVVKALPIDRIVHSSRRELFFIGWTTTDLLFIAACTSLDGGAESPFALLFALPLVFGSLSYPIWATAAIGAVTVVSFLGIALTVGGGLHYSSFGAFGLLCLALLSAWEARNQAQRRGRIAHTAAALRDSEEQSRIKTAQQREVAAFGQLALGGADIEHLQDEGVRLLTRILEVDIAAVLRRPPGQDHIIAVAQEGLPEDVGAAMKLPVGTGSQAGYTLATGTPIVVPDWQTEQRFEQSRPLREVEIQSGATVLIKIKDEPWGVLGVQSRPRRTFLPEDVDFMQAVANVLANAIERRIAEERTQHEALHDPLTGLANRSLFLDRLEHALEGSKRHGKSVAVLFCDLDQFKLVNDSLGHAAGDELRAAVAPRLQQALRPGDTVARFGGDEFAVLAEDITSERDATRIAERIGEALARPLVLRRREHFASASIGISIGSGTQEPEALIRDADAAMYRAKEHGRGGYELFDEVMRSRVIDHMETENDLRRALQRREFELHYQPVISLADGETVMYEALLRWHHPERGLIGPPAFIPVAEESRLIVPIGRWVIEEACRRAAEWQALAPDSRPVGVSVNLAACQLGDPELLHCVRAALDESGIDPATLRLELTESTLLEEVDSPEIGLEALRSLGVRLILDDFGTGFSSLGYLKRLPLAGIKLDRAFVENLAEGGEDAAIVSAVNAMAGALGLDVCAEGIESPEQLELVRELGCTHAQGFHFAMPGPAEEVVTELATGAPTTG